MLVTFKSLGFEVAQECGGYPEAFGFIGDCAQAFGIKQCGACGSENISPEHRQAKGYDFYSWKCGSCFNVLKFGITKEGGRLFPKLKGDNDEYLPNNGWHKETFQQNSGQQNGQQSQQRSAPRTAAPPAPF
jgi:hypothetical protein